MDPWDVPVKQSVLVMQKIWDATSTYEYEMTASTTVYKKVCNQLASRVIDITMDFQMVQCLADSWQNAIGSTSITAILMFCDSQEDLQDSDEEHMEFAKNYLKDLRFLYQDADNDDKKVCHTDYYPCHTCV